ncbi:MAG: sigma factor [Bacteroidota bacterium]
MELSREKEYVDQAIQGDKQAFNVLADFYYADCFRKAKSILDDETLAQDITQISLLQAYRSLDKLQTPSRFKFWLFGIVRNISYNYIRQKRQSLISLEHVWEEIWLRLQKCESDNYFGFCHKTTSILCKLSLQSYPIHNGKL